MDDSIKIGAFIDFNGCTGCGHLFIEEVDYDYFVREDYSGIAVPEGENPPLIVCMKDSPRMVSASLGEKCSEYRGIE